MLDPLSLKLGDRVIVDFLQSGFRLGTVVDYEDMLKFYSDDAWKEAINEFFTDGGEFNPEEDKILLDMKNVGNLRDKLKEEETRGKEKAEESESLIPIPNAEDLYDYAITNKNYEFIPRSLIDNYVDFNKSTRQRVTKKGGSYDKREGARIVVRISDEESDSEKTQKPENKREPHFISAPNKIGTIKKVLSKKIVVMFDDALSQADVYTLADDDPRIVGEGTDRKRKTPISDASVKGWLKINELPFDFAWHEGDRVIFEEYYDSNFLGTITIVRNGKLIIELDSGKKIGIPMNSPRIRGRALEKESKTAIPEDMIDLFKDRLEKSTKLELEKNDRVIVKTHKGNFLGIVSKIIGYQAVISLDNGATKVLGFDSPNLLGFAKAKQNVDSKTKARSLKMHPEPLSDLELKDWLETTKDSKTTSVLSFKQGDRILVKHEGKYFLGTVKRTDKVNKIGNECLIVDLDNLDSKGKNRRIDIEKASPDIIGRGIAETHSEPIAKNNLNRFKKVGVGLPKRFINNISSFTPHKLQSEGELVRKTSKEIISIFNKAGIFDKAIGSDFQVGLKHIDGSCTISAIRHYKINVNKVEYAYQLLKGKDFDVPDFAKFQLLDDLLKELNKELEDKLLEWKKKSSVLNKELEEGEFTIELDNKPKKMTLTKKGIALRNRKLTRIDKEIQTIRDRIASVKRQLPRNVLVIKKEISKNYIVVHLDHNNVSSYISNTYFFPSLADFAAFLNVRTPDLGYNVNDWSRASIKPTKILTGKDLEVMIFKEGIREIQDRVEQYTKELDFLLP